ncbi:MaoC/PaaZ C-terminal domain-containing protein, partial [Paracoccus sp. (in: a-proteobacteria)]
MTRFQSIPFDRLETGMSAEIRRLCVMDDLLVFAHSSGNLNPLHLAGADEGAQPVAPSMWLGSLISAVLGDKLPGPGTLYKSQSLQFHRRVSPGDELVIRVELTGKGPDRTTRFLTTVSLTDGTPVVTGVAEVTAPDKTISVDAADLPGLNVQRHVHFDRLLQAVEAVEP